MFRFLLSSRWIGFALFVVLLSAICVRLGLWQFDRLDHRLAQNKVISAHFKAAPIELPPGFKVDDSTEWTRVTATGTYDLDHQVTVKFTTRDGAPGVDVVTPLVLADDSAVLVDRGWIETDNTVANPDVPAPPTGTVTVMGWMRQNNGAGGQATEPVDGQVRAISSIGMAKSVPYELSNGYLNLRTQDPKATQALELEPKPELGQGPHFFYALQWWFFALLATVGYFWFAWAEAKERRNPTRIDGFATPS
ncbi:cytochrome oxidase assembly protein ShyY1 [Aeromicrobium panaciterrae]|uniref:SURF1-like protein n=1 Tax=Aeromicrobium panaciterrae TaxID=363861 RepID=A0ABU1UP66_9ACTN|nr:SURF1 family protein [Aeromicrobium panaciterrae]MDR7086978.1 cytochrome oxidase assembly protein ShyY1 [Aeromicrobium panaciterrae]